MEREEWASFQENWGVEMPSINLELGYFTHRKTKRLIGRLGRGADLLPIRLWCYCGMHYAKDGILNGHTIQEIESAIDWWGKPGECVEALSHPDIKFLELRGDTYTVHDWLEHSGHLGAFSERARVAALARWDKIKGRCPSNAPSNAKVEGEECPHQPTNQPTKPSKSKSAIRPSDEVEGGEFKTVTDYWLSRFKSTQGFDFPADAKSSREWTILAELWRRCEKNSPTTKATIDVFLADSYWKKQGFPLAGLKSQMTKYIGLSKGKAVQSDNDYGKIKQVN